MRVLVLTESFPTPEHPGRGVFVREQTQALAQTHEVTVLFPRPALPLIASRYLEPRAQSLDHEAKLPETKSFELCRPPYFYIPRNRRIRTRQLARLTQHALRSAPRPYDVIHAHWLAPAGAAAVKAALMFDIPVVLTAHAGDVYRDLNQAHHQRVVDRVLTRTARVIAVAEYFREPLLKAGINPEKLSVIPNGVNLRVFKPADRNEARRMLRLPVGVPMFLYIGNLQHAKGAADVVEAFFTHAPQEAILVIAGTGPLWGQFCARSEASAGRFVLRGWQPHDAVAKYLAAADCFILASYAEGNPVTVLESLCCGTPVIGSSIAAIKPLIEEGSSGLLCDAGDVAALGQAMRSLLTRHWDHTMIARRAADRYGWPTIAARISEIYEATHAEHRERRGAAISKMGQQ